MHSTNQIKTGRAALLATTGLASAAALVSGAHSALAEGVYAGVSISAIHGDAPNEAAGYPDNYELAGHPASVFVGTKFMDFGSMTLGGEIAYTGHIEVVRFV